VGYYFVYWAPGFSSRHLAINLVFYTILYVGVVLAAIRAFAAAYAGLLFAVVFALFHGLQQLDFDWRYRLPCLLPLIYLAIVGYSRAWLALRQPNNEPARPLSAVSF
jgi:hypothetical protein